MGTERDRIVDGVAEMIRLTQQGDIVWRPFTGLVGSTVLTNDSPGYETVFNERRLRLYPTAFSGPTLEFIDQNGIALYRFPSIQALSDLLATVSYQTAGVKGFLDDLLRPRAK